jgi:serine/threonine-protein kinase RsbW
MMKTELTIPSDLKFLPVVEEWLLESLKIELGEQVHWTQVEPRLRLVIVEVYSNIVRHAHHQQPEMPVLLRIELQGNSLSMEVWDQGEGFNLSDYSAPDPSAFQEGGYGWLILHRIMDRVEYQLQVNGERNCLKLEKTFTSGLVTA